MTPEYQAFLAAKAPKAPSFGFDPMPVPDHLFDFQRAAVEFCIRQGRAALFLDCLGGEATIETDKGAVRIDELMDGGASLNVLSINARGNIVPARATAPFRKGRAPLYRVETKSGRVIIGTRGHRILTPSGWIAVGDLSVGMRLVGYVPSLPASNSGRGLLMSRQDARHSGQTHEGLMGDYSKYHRQYGQPLLPSSGIYQERPPLQGGVHGHDDCDRRLDGRAHMSEYSLSHRYTGRPSMPGYDPRDMNVVEEPGCLLHSCGSELFERYTHIEMQAVLTASPQSSSGGLLPSEGRMNAGVPLLSPDYVVCIHYIRYDDFYDLHVPGYENYLGDGFVSHNTGLGKTVCELEFARQAGEKSNGVALLLTPLAVARQIEREGLRFGYNCRVVRDQSEVSPGINICNYDRLDKLDASAFGGVVLDESSILKSFSGSTTRALIAQFADTPYRLAASATPAPNDHTELGNHAEFLGIMPMADMLIRWFINDSADTGTWRLKGHAVTQFWDWVSSWAVMASSPDDLGFDGSQFVLPPMHIIRHKVSAEIAPNDGLFGFDVSATDMFALKRQTAEVRADEVARLVASEPDEPWLIWVDTDYEADAVVSRIKHAIDVRGSMSPEKKEEGLLAFLTTGRPLVTKSRIAGQGLNYQHCARQAFVGRSFSYEAWYQAVRRSWRFGQTREVHVHLIVAEGEDQIGRVIDRKSDDHEAMREHMRAAARRSVGVSSAVKVPYNPTYEGRLPQWLKSAA